MQDARDTNDNPSRRRMIAGGSDGSVQTLGVGTFPAPAGTLVRAGIPGLPAVLRERVPGHTPNVWTVPGLRRLPRLSHRRHNSPQHRGIARTTQNARG
jgi:hypothetical protein